jgi:hypothetical protein
MRVSLLTLCCLFALLFAPVRCVFDTESAYAPQESTYLWFVSVVTCDLDLLETSSYVDPTPSLLLPNTTGICLGVSVVPRAACDGHSTAGTIGTLSVATERISGPLYSTGAESCAPSPLATLKVSSMGIRPYVALSHPERFPGFQIDLQNVHTPDTSVDISPITTAWYIPISCQHPGSYFLDVLPDPWRAITAEVNGLDMFSTSDAFFSIIAPTRVSVTCAALPAIADADHATTASVSVDSKTAFAVGQYHPLLFKVADTTNATHGYDDYASAEVRLRLADGHQVSGQSALLLTDVSNDLSIASLGSWPGAGELLADPDVILFNVASTCHYRASCVNQAGYAPFPVLGTSPAGSSGSLLEAIYGDEPTLYGQAGWALDYVSVTTAVTEPLTLVDVTDGDTAPTAHELLVPSGSGPENFLGTLAAFATTPIGAYAGTASSLYLLSAWHQDVTSSSSALFGTTQDLSSMNQLPSFLKLLDIFGISRSPPTDYADYAEFAARTVVSAVVIAAAGLPALSVADPLLLVPTLTLVTEESSLTYTRYVTGADNDAEAPVAVITGDASTESVTLATTAALPIPGPIAALLSISGASAPGALASELQPYLSLVMDTGSDVVYSYTWATRSARLSPDNGASVRTLAILAATGISVSDPTAAAVVYFVIAHDAPLLPSLTANDFGADVVPALVQLQGTFSLLTVLPQTVPIISANICANPSTANDVFLLPATAASPGTTEPIPLILSSGTVAASGTSDIFLYGTALLHSPDGGHTWGVVATAYDEDATGTLLDPSALATVDSVATSVDSNLVAFSLSTGAIFVAPITRLRTDIAMLVPAKQSNYQTAPFDSSRLGLSTPLRMAASRQLLFDSYSSDNTVLAELLFTGWDTSATAKVPTLARSTNLMALYADATSAALAARRQAAISQRTVDADGNYSSAFHVTSLSPSNDSSAISVSCPYSSLHFDYAITQDVTRLGHRPIAPSAASVPRVFLDYGDEYYVDLHIEVACDPANSEPFADGTSGVSSPCTTLPELSAPSLSLSRPSLLFVESERTFDDFAVPDRLTPSYIAASLTSAASSALDKRSAVFRVHLVETGALANQLSSTDYVSSSDERRSASGAALAATELVIDVIGATSACVLSPRSRQHMAMGAKSVPASPLSIHVLHGCPPYLSVSLDEVATGTDSVLNLADEAGIVGANFDLTWSPVFQIVDGLSGNTSTFNGTYEIAVVGGGAYADQIAYFSNEEIEAYNLGSASIWGVSDSVDAENYTTGDTSFLFPDGNGGAELTAGATLADGASGITWTCLSGSPCYDLSPRVFGEPPVYYLRVRVATRAAGTYCMHTTEFDIRLQNVESGFVTTVLQTFGLTALLYLVMALVHMRQQALARRAVEQGLVLGELGRVAGELSGDARLANLQHAEEQSTADPHVPSETEARSPPK